MALMVSEPIELWSSQKTSLGDKNSKHQTKSSKKVHMLSRCQKVFAKLEDSLEVSNEISTYAPGTREKFSLQRRNKLYEFGYAT